LIGNQKTPNMLTPLFKYSSQLLEQVAQAGILFSEQSILRLNCGHENPTSQQQLALANFEIWKDQFYSNCNAAFYAAPQHAIDRYETVYKADLLSALLIAELYDWSAFKSLDKVNTAAAFKWEGERFQRSRLFTELI